MLFYYFVGIPVVLLLSFLFLRPAFQRRAKIRRIKNEYPTTQAAIVDYRKAKYGEDSYVCTFTYTVGGKDYTGDGEWSDIELLALMGETNTTVIEELKRGLLFGPGSSVESPKELERQQKNASEYASQISLVKDTLKSSKFPVHYNPDNPDKAYLEKNVDDAAQTQALVAGVIAEVIMIFGFFLGSNYSSLLVKLAVFAGFTAFGALMVWGMYYRKTDLG